MARKETMKCCSSKNACSRRREKSGFFAGIAYGLIPHVGCIAFIAFTILGITTATAFLKPLLMSRYFFYILIALSLVFATISALVYLGRNGELSVVNAKRRWRYLSVLYGTTVGINALLYIVIFPVAANMTTAAVLTDGYSEITLKVDIPCPGHAPLISEELKRVNGVNSVNFNFPDYFDVYYDSAKTSKEDILSLGIFDEYPARVSASEISGSESQRQTKGRGCSCGRCESCTVQFK